MYLRFEKYAYCTLSWSNPVFREEERGERRKNESKEAENDGAKVVGRKGKKKDWKMKRLKSFDGKKYNPISS